MGGANWIRVKAIKNKFGIIQLDDIPKEKEPKSNNTVKVKTIDLCENCNRPLSSPRRGRKTNYCQACHHEIVQRIAERPSREDFKAILRKMPFTQIGQKYGVSDNAIRKWAKNYCLPFKSSEIKKFTDEEWEKL